MGEGAARPYACQNRRDCVPYLGVTTLSPRVLRRNDRYLQGLPPCRVFAPGIATNANQPIVALLLHPKNHPLRLCGLDHHRHRKCVVVTIPKSTRMSIAETNQAPPSTDMARSPLETEAHRQVGPNLFRIP